MLMARRLRGAALGLFAWSALWAGSVVGLGPGAGEW